MSSSTQTEEVKTDHLTVSLQRNPGCQIHLDMQISPEGTKAAYLKAIKAVNKEVSIPGFRKGKAPDALVVDKFGKYVKQEWSEILLQTSFNEFLKKTHLLPFTQDQSIKKAEIKKISNDEGSLIVIEYEARPEIPEVEESELVIQEVSREPVTEDDIEETLRQIQLRHATWTEISDRPIQEGDFVDLTIDAMEHPPRNICQNMRFEVVSGKMGRWMKDLILGRSVGETVEGMSEQEEGKVIPDFKSTLCKITINSIKSAEIPPLDDELAAKVGLKQIVDLRPRVEQDLNKKADEEVKDLQRAQIEDYLLEKYNFEIPYSIIAQQKEEILNKKVEALSRNEEQPEAMIEMVKELETSVDKELSRAYRLFFLARKIAEKNNIQVYENEIMTEMMKQVMLPPGQGIIDHSMPAEQIRSKLFVNVLTQKALDYLVNKATATKA